MTQIIDKRWSIYDTNTGRRLKTFPDRNIARYNAEKDKRWLSGEIGIKSVAIVSRSRYKKMYPNSIYIKDRVLKK